MKVFWRYGLLISNSLMIFGCYYLMEIPVGLQNEMIYSHDSSLRSNTTQNQTKCRVCLGLGEFRYNLMFSATRWMSVAVCLPSGFVIDKLGNGRSAVLFSTLLFLGSVVFAVGATTQAPVSTPVYLLMLMGYASLAFGDASLRFVQARVISHCFPEATLSALAISVLGYIGEAISLYITPIVATDTGVQTAVWLGPAACGIGVFFAIGLAILIQVQTHTIAEDKESKNIMSVSVLKSLPRTYWLFMFTVSFTAACWMVKQANLPDYLEWRHGYSMLDASHIVAISPSIYLSCPLFCLVLKKIGCDGIIYAFFLLWMMICYTLLGFCPSVNIILLSIADGVGLMMTSTLVWQFIVVLSPPAYVGTLGGLIFTVRNLATSLTFIAAGYILQKGEVSDNTLRQYQYFFIMVILMSIMGTVLAVLVNVADIRKDVSLNSRIRRWQQSNTESLRLISMDKSNFE